LGEWWVCLAIDLIAQTGLSSLPVIYYLEQLFSKDMSPKGNCWDNACVESFIHSIKVEALQDEPLMIREQMRQAVFEYIEVDYNRTRRHSALEYLSQENFELKNSA